MRVKENKTQEPLVGFEITFGHASTDNKLDGYV